MFDALLDQISRVKSAVSGKPEFRWGVVSGVAPLQVTLDADTSPLAGVPSTLVSGLVVGQRVQCVIQNHRVTVVGVAHGGVPAGVLSPFAGSVAPAGYLLCDGSAVSRTTFAGLYAVIGVTYGPGNGSTTFNLPDARGRTLVGLSSDTEFNTLGKKYGTKTHTLTITETAPHTHLQRALSGVIASGGGSALAGMAYTGGTYVDSSAFTASSGGGDPHNNVQPSMTVNYIIKT